MARAEREAWEAIDAQNIAEARVPEPAVGVASVPPRSKDGDGAQSSAEGDHHAPDDAEGDDADPHMDMDMDMAHLSRAERRRLRHEQASAAP